MGFGFSHTGFPNGVYGSIVIALYCNITNIVNILFLKHLAKLIADISIKLNRLLTIPFMLKYVNILTFSSKRGATCSIHVLVHIILKIL